MFRYTEALSILPPGDGKHRLLANRSLAYLRGKRIEDALADAQAGVIPGPLVATTVCDVLACSGDSEGATTLCVAVCGAD